MSAISDLIIYLIAFLYEFYTALCSLCPILQKSIKNMHDQYLATFFKNNSTEAPRISPSVTEHFGIDISTG